MIFLFLIKKVDIFTFVLKVESTHIFSKLRVISVDYLIQGFSTFWYSRTPKSKLYPSAYPQIRIVSPLRTPQKNSTQISFIWVSFFKFCVPLWAPHVPLWAPHVPPVASSRPLGD
jgi:hypothetical protein